MKTKAPSELKAEYKRSAVVFLQTAAVLGQIALNMREAASEYAGLEPFAPEPGYLDTSNPESGLCKLIRRAVALKWLRGDEDFLDEVNWR